MTTTGEQPAMREPSLSLSFDRAVVLLGLFGSLAAAWAGYRVTQADVEAHGKRLEAVESRQQASEMARGDVALQLARIDERLKTLSEKMDDLKASGVVNARGRAP